MNKEDQQKLSQYYKEIRLLMPLHGAYEKRFLQDVKNSIDDYIEHNPNCTFEQILEHFDEPYGVVCTYLENVEKDRLYKKIKINHLIKKCILFVIIVVVAACLIRTAFVYKAYLHAKEQTPVKVIDVIE